MTWIQVGRFDAFKGSDTLLIECDQGGLQSLVDALKDVGTRGEGFSLEQRLGVVLHGGISVAVERSRTDVGLVAAGTRGFVWQRSSEAWLEVVEKLGAMQCSGPGHQYFSNAPADALQIIVSVNEYGEEWWSTHAPAGK
jgi:hypothetical protein